MKLLNSFYNNTLFILVAIVVIKIMLELLAGPAGRERGGVNGSITCIATCFPCFALICLFLFQPM